MERMAPNNRSMSERSTGLRNVSCCVSFRLTANIPKIISRHYNRNRCSIANKKGSVEHSALDSFANVLRYRSGKHFRRKNLAVVQLTSELGGEWSTDKQTKANPRSRPFSTFSLF